MRLIQSGLIAKKYLLRKFSCELHVNEIVLLAYYIASINIKNAFNADSQNYFPFQGICLTDTFEMYEHDEISTFEFALEKIAEIQSVLSEKFNPQILIPNEKFDWINQRGNIFETLIPLAPDQKFDIKSKSFFVTNSNGIKTGHDIVSYNFSKKSLEKNIESFIRGKKLKFDKKKIILSSYRPFCEENFYYDFNQRRYQFEKIFPSGEEENFLICVSGVGSKKNFSAFLINKITDLELVSKSQCFPMYWYERAEVEQKSLFDDGKEKYKQCDGVSDFILNQAKSLYGE